MTANQFWWHEFLHSLHHDLLALDMDSLATDNRLQDIQDQNAIEMCTEFLEHKTDDYV